MDTKICKKCGRELPLSEFNKSKRDGLQSWCKVCKKQYRADNLEKNKQYLKQWRADNAETIKQYMKQWQADNAETIKQYKKQWYADNLEYIKQYRAEHKEEISAYQKQYDAKRYATIERYARVIRKDNLRNDRKYSRIGANEDPLPTIEQYIELLQQKDYYDGKQYPFNEMGLDRIDNSKPHTLDNVVPCSTAHNIQRGRKSFEQFCELIKKQNELELVL